MALIKPGSGFFTGRTEAITRLRQLLRRDTAVLLYGGRQSGKTAFLLGVANEMRAKTARVSELATLDIPVYVDLTTLQYDAAPPHFFGLLVAKTREALTRQIDGFSAPEHSSAQSLEGFVRCLSELRARCGEVDARPVFLVDEAKRILGERFPRGFQDNLFAILYGELSDAARCAMVFAGAQHLDDFSKDDTSPIGSRAGTIFLEVLGADAIRQLLQLLLPALDDHTVTQLTPSLSSLTGGHAGTLAKLLEAYASDTSTDINQHAALLYDCSFGLFENWTLSFSAEALATIDALTALPSLGISEIAADLDSRGLRRYFARRAIEELRYTGVARWIGERLESCNELYWKFIKEFGPVTRVENGPGAVWLTIEETELTLRQLVERKLKANFGEGAEDVMKRILGDEAWEKIHQANERGSKQYRFSPGGANRGLTSCMYLGQLGTLMVNRETWPLFKGPYRDKRELEDRLAAIAPVRTDRAHFVTVPQKELDRCKIACDDLLIITERELAALESKG